MSVLVESRAAPPRAADGRVIGATLACALGADLAVRSGVACITGAALVVTVSASLTLGGRSRNPHAWALAAAAVPLGAALAVRTSPWVIGPDVLAIAALLVLSASFARGGSMIDLTVPQVVTRAVSAALDGLRGPAFVLSGGRDARVPAVVRGLLIAAPFVLIAGALLASGDAVFAGFVRVRLDPPDLVLHVVLLSAGAWGMSGLLRAASSPAPDGVAAPESAVGRVESIVVLTCMDALFALFGASQLVALSAGGRHVIETAGLTYAEYARSGFFQLLAVSAITLAALLALRAASDRSPAFTVLAEIAVGLTLLIVVVALRRLMLYERAYGLTMLRLASVAVAVWIGVVLVLLAAYLGAGPGRQWFVSAAGACAFAGLLAFNVVNPEAIVVRRNVSRSSSSVPFDAAYASALSDDAVPELARALALLDPVARDDVVRRICVRSPGGMRGWAAYNGARDGATEARNRVCST